MGAFKRTPVRLRLGRSFLDSFSSPTIEQHRFDKTSNM
jgi:hypothetical protein